MLSPASALSSNFLNISIPVTTTFLDSSVKPHLAFRVKSVAEAAARLNALGVATEPIRQDPYTHCAMTFFKDPDGLPLEIHE